MLRYLLLGLALVACGDNSPPTCEVPAAELPASGDVIDPYAIEIAADCVDAGLRDAPRRWFVRDPAQLFVFEYPRIEGSCTTGFARTGSDPDDHDLDDGFSRYTWSDGTRFFRRIERRYRLPDGETYSYVSAAVMCMVSPDELAATYITSSRYGANMPDVEISHAIGTPFARRDAVADGIERVGEVGTNVDGEPIEALNLIVEGGYAYIAASNGLDIIDVTDPAAPVPVAHRPGSFNDIRIVHAADLTYAILAPSGGDRTLIVDVTDPAAPIAVSVIDEYSHSLFVQQRGGVTELYLANYEDVVPVFDITNPLLPQKLGDAQVPGDPYGVHDLFVDGDRIYANYTSGGLVAFDRSGGFAQTTALGHLATSYSHASWLGTAGGRKVLLHGDEGMTGTPDGGAFLRVLDGDPASPTFLTELGRYQSRPSVGIHNIEMHDSRAYIAYYHDGVRVVDLSDPTAPAEVAHYNTWDVVNGYGAAFEGAVGIRVVDGLIYVADLQRGLLVLREQP